MNDFSIRRLAEVSKPNLPEAIDDTIRTVRNLPVNTGFLTCADSPETYNRKLDWWKLTDKERNGIARCLNLAGSMSRRLSKRCVRAEPLARPSWAQTVMQPRQSHAQVCQYQTFHEKNPKWQGIMNYYSYLCHVASSGIT